MEVVTYDEYNKLKAEFIKKHDNDFTLETSPLDNYNRYNKQYIFKDGSIWYEITGPSVEDIEVEVKKVNVKISVPMYRTEFWNTDDSRSKVYYEKY